MYIDFAINFAFKEAQRSSWSRWVVRVDEVGLQKAYGYMRTKKNTIWIETIKNERPSFKVWKIYSREWCKEITSGIKNQAGKDYFIHSFIFMTKNFFKERKNYEDKIKEIVSLTEKLQILEHEQKTLNDELGIASFVLKIFCFNKFSLQQRKVVLNYI